MCKYLVNKYWQPAPGFVHAWQQCHGETGEGATKSEAEYRLKI